MKTCYIGIGSNLGDRRKLIYRAVDILKAAKGVKFNRMSSVYETKPEGSVPQGKFLNGVIEVTTDLSPRRLLVELNRIEDILGRKRTIKNAPRTMDLDILYYGDDVVKDPGLEIPHPKIAERDFVLRGLKELGKSV